MAKNDDWDADDLDDEIENGNSGDTAAFRRFENHRFAGFAGRRGGVPVRPRKNTRTGDEQA